MIKAASGWEEAMRENILAEEDPFTMELVGEDAEAVVAAVEMGIDSHLEACFIRERGDEYDWFGDTGRMKLYCSVSSESLCCLVRRLLEDVPDGHSLASGILSALDNPVEII